MRSASPAQLTFGDDERASRELRLSPMDALRHLRNYLAGQVVGLTRDEALLEEVVKCVFCKVELERKGSSRTPNAKTNSEDVARSYRQTFREIKDRFPALFPADAELLLGPRELNHIDRILSQIDSILDGVDLVGTVYQTFLGAAYRGQEGQFFTPGSAVFALVEMTRPNSKDIVIDPACGSGGFLLQAAARISASGRLDASRIHGVDKDDDLVRLARIHLAVRFDAQFPVQCADSLVWAGNHFERTPTHSLEGKFTLVLTNPPFGSRIVALEGSARNDFELAHKWVLDQSGSRYVMLRDFSVNTPPQELFVERCISLLGDRGRLGMVVPESLLSNPSHRHVVQYILAHTTPISVVGMPESLFKTSGKGGTHTKVCLLVLEKRKPRDSDKIFMAEAAWCGFDSRARQVPRDDLPQILQKFREYSEGRQIQNDRFGFLVSLQAIRSWVLAPRFYDPEPGLALEQLRQTYDLCRVGDLVEAGKLEIASGDEVGKLCYGSGEIPFVRTSDLSNWEIKLDPKHGVSEEVYSRLSAKQDVREGDILFVRDGTYLIGTCGYVSRDDTRVVYQSHILKLRVLSGAPFDNYFLLAALSSAAVQSQVRAFSFTQDVIDTLGNRINDIVIPVPKSRRRIEEVSRTVRESIQLRLKARELTRLARDRVAA